MSVTASPALTPSSPRQRLRDVDAFFMKQDATHSTLERLAARLDEEEIPWLLVGGMALGLHGYERMTRDVDILLTPEGLAAFEARCVGRGYVPKFPGARRAYLDTQTRVPVEILCTGEFPGDGLPKPVAFPDPAAAGTVLDGIKVITLEKLIELKLASGLTAPHRLRDLADVQDLIIALTLPRELAARLDPSVRAEYARLWEASRQK